MFNDSLQVVKKCLDACPDWELVKPPQFAEKWKNFGSPKWKHVGKKCIYAKSDVDLTDGFFMAVFERRVDVNELSVDHDPDRDFLEQIRRNFEPPTVESEGESDDQMVPKKEPTDKIIKQEKDAASLNPFKVKAEPEDGGYNLVERNIIKTEIVIEDPTAAAEPVKKKLKKVKPTEPTEATRTDEPVDRLCEVTKKKKKKKRLHEESDIAEEILTVEEIPLEKTKKKKSKRNVDEKTIPDEIVDQPIKKEKRIHQNDQQQFDIDVNETTTTTLKKKKKKKDNLSTETV